MTAANTKDCFRELIGHTVKGVLFDALPLSDNSLATGTKAIVLDDGRALVVASNGAYWIASAQDVSAAVRRRRAELATVSQEIKDVLSLAGES